MASFGWSAGDVIAIATLAYKIYKTCEGAGDEYRSLALDVRTLQALLQDVGNEIEEPTSVIHNAGKSKRQQLVNLLEDCNTELRDLERYLLQYRSLKSAKPRLRDRLRFGIKPISQIRLKLSQHTDGLNLFLTHMNTSSLGRLEQASQTNASILDDIRMRLDDLRHQVEIGQKDVSVLDIRSNWSNLEKELVGSGLTKRDVISNRNSIQEYITTWLEGSELDEYSIQSDVKESKSKRTSSMLHWTPEESPYATHSAPLPQVIQSRRLACEPSLSNSVTEMWDFIGRDSPSAESEISEEISTSCDSVFSSGSPLSSRCTTPGPLDRSVDDTLGPDGKLMGLTTDGSSCDGIESLMDELDAFVLDISRSSTPDTIGNTETQDVVLDSQIEEPTIMVPRRRVVTRPLPLTLEEAFCGGVKQRKIRGRLLAERNEQNEMELRESGIDVPFPAGARPGLIIELPNVAVGFDGVPQDLHFVVEWKKHDVIQWDGKDLVITINITLLESLCGWLRDFQTIDGKQLHIQRSEVTPPTWSHLYPGFGMPQPGTFGTRSDLIVKVNVEYPETISQYQDKIFKRVLTPKTELSPRMQQLLQENQYCI